MSFNKRIIILMYHSIDDPVKSNDRRYTCSTELFKKHMKFLVSNGYHVIALNDATKALQGKLDVPEKLVVVTFDDGFEDNYINAFPIVSDYKIPVTIFLVSDQIGKNNKWMIKESFNEKKMLNWQQIQEMSESNVEFGGHTLNHKKLTMIDTDEVFKQVSECKNNLEQKLGKKVNSFAYPYGLYNAESVNMVRNSGYNVSCCTRPGFNNIKTDPFLLRRIEIKGTDSTAVLKRKMTFGTNEESPLVPAKYYLSRISEKIRVLK